MMYKNGLALLIHLISASVIVGKPTETYRSFLEAGPWLQRETLNLKEKVLQLHSETRGDSILGASDMSALKWNEDLEILAQTKANRCSFSHGDLELPDGRYVGQNLAKAAGFLQDPVESLVKLWIAEKPLFNMTLARCSEKISSRIPCGHFHQMVTGESRDIGCAISVCHLCPWLNDNKDSQENDDDDDDDENDGFGKCFWFDVMLVCDYFPRGVGDQPAYKRGSPCSDCNYKPGTECINNQCQNCGNVSSESMKENTRSTSSTSTPDLKPPAEESTVLPPTKVATTPAACRPYNPEDCNDEFSDCNGILQSDFCSSPLTGMWARDQCRKFCNYC